MPILAQDVRSVRRYIEEVGFPFDILVDEQREAARAYGVWHRAGITAWNIARPAVFLLEPDRTIRYIAVAQGQAEFPSQEEVMRVVDG